MKSTSLVAISLALFMLLLVLIAAFIFSFKGQQDLKATYVSDLDTIKNQKNQAELDENAARSTTTAIYSTAGAKEAEFYVTATAQSANLSTANSKLSTAGDDIQDLDTQIVEINRTAEAQKVVMEKQLADLQEAQSTRDYYEELGPLVTFIEPQNTITITVDIPVNGIVIASDPKGVRSVSVIISDGSFFPSDVDVVEPILEHRFSWTPTSPGNYKLTATAFNVNNSLSQQPPPFREVIVIEAPPTELPRPIP